MQARPGDWTETRIAKAQQLGADPEIPDAGELAYLIDTLFDAGPTIFTPMGEAPLHWSDLMAYSTMTGARLEPWEARALKDMSIGYLAAKRAGEDVLSIPPVRLAKTE